MPAGKQGQSSAMTIALVTFVVLFLLTTVAAIFFYVKWDENTVIADKEVQNRRQAATDKEVSEFAALVGQKTADSYLGTVIEQFDKVYQDVTGNVKGESLTVEAAAEQISLEIKAIRAKFQGVVMQDAGLIPIAKTLAGEYIRATQAAMSLQENAKMVQDNWTRDVEGFKVAEDKLAEEKSILLSQADKVQSNFDQMKSAAEGNAEQRIALLQSQLDDKNKEIENFKSTFAQLQASLKEEKQYREKLEDQLEQIKPRPDIEVAAYKPDGRIVSVNAQQGIVYLDLGSDAHIYRGLTFAVYDRANPVPEDGKGKAEIKVFDVRSKVSVARIISEDKENPVLPEDIIVNLIWDKDKPNTFYVSGQFDLDGDGKIDNYGTDKVVHLIKQWGGIVTDVIDINTDFVVAGQLPAVYEKPSDNEVDMVLAEQKYEESMKQFKEYQAAVKRAEALSIPVFNTDRFKSLIGYNKEVLNDQTN